MNGPIRIERSEGVHHKHPSGGGLVPSQFVLHNEGVAAVVDMGGLVEGETAIIHGSVTGVTDEVGVCVFVLDELLVIVQPGDVRLRVAVHSEGETPVVLWHGISQEENFGRN